MEFNQDLARFFQSLEVQVPRMLDRDTEITDEFLSDSNPKLCLMEYFQYIPPEIFQQSENTVTSVDFIGTTCFQNFLSVLQQFPNLDTIKFWNVSLDDYSLSGQALPEHEKIPVPTIRTVEFGSDEPMHITPGESKIISFLTYCSSHLNIRTIKFSGHSDWLMVPVHNEVVHSFGHTVPLETLGKFIIATAPTLENLYCNRDQECLPDGEELDGYSRLQLTHLSCRVSTTGVGYILKNQHRLNSFTFGSYTHIASGYLPCIFSAMEYISSCTQRCALSLTTIKMFDIPIIYSAQTYPQSTALELSNARRVTTRKFRSLCKIDLSVYQNCNQLHYLKVKLSKLYLYAVGVQQANPESATVIFGTFLNGQTIPTSLRVLKLNVGFVTQDELLLLTSRFRDLENLEKFILESSTAYVITKECFQNVLALRLEQFVSCMFRKGHLANDFIPQALLSNHDAADGLHWELTISKNHVKLYPSVVMIIDD